MKGLAPRHRDLAALRHCLMEVGINDEVYEEDEEDQNRRKRQLFHMKKNSIDSP